MDPSDGISPYAPPNEVDDSLTTVCPQCGQPMSDGELFASSTITWRTASTGFLKSFLFGGKKLGQTKSGIGYRIAANYCENCRLIQIKR